MKHTNLLLIMLLALSFTYAGCKSGEQSEGPVEEVVEEIQEKHEEMEEEVDKSAPPKLAAELAKNAPAPEKLKKVLRLIFQFYFQHMDVLRILSRDETHLIREHFEFTEHWRDRRVKLYQKILEKGIKEGSFRPANTKLTAQIIFGLVGSVTFFYQSDKNAGDIAEEVFAMISEGITVHSTANTKAAKK